MDFRYLLFFERAAQLEVLEHLAALAVPGGGDPTTLVLPERSVSLPFSGWIDTGRKISWDDDSATWDFMTVLCFEPDEAIEWYLAHRSGPAASPDQDYDEQGRAKIGYVYLSVDRAMTGQPSGTGEELVRFAFGTPGSSMSVLFTESESIRRAFVGLLESCRGVYGMLDREDAADLFWWRGRPLSEVLPTAELRLADIEELVGTATALPFTHKADEVAATARHLRRTYGGVELGTHHWLLALLDTGTDLTGWLGPTDPDRAAAHLRHRLSRGEPGSALPEAQVRARATERARRSGDTQVRSDAVAHVVTQAADEVEPGP